MKKVTARPVDTFVQADRTEIVNLNQRQKQINSAFNALGVNVKQRVQQNDEDELFKASASASSFLQQARHPENQKASLEDLKSTEGYAKALGEIEAIGNARTREKARAQLHTKITETLSKNSADLREKARDAKLNLLADASGAEAGLAFAEMSAVENRYMSADEFKATPYIQGALKAIQAIPDEYVRAAKLQDFNQKFDATMIGIQNGLEREDNITSFGKTVANVFQGEYQSGDISKLVDEHKEVLGPDAVTSAATIALSFDEVGAIDDLLARDDLYPQTIAQLQNGKDRILANQAKASKESKLSFLIGRDQADRIEDRSKRVEVLTVLFEQNFDLLSDTEKAGMVKRIEVAQEELKAEDIVNQQLGFTHTRDLADPANYPEGVKALPIGEIKKIQDRAFNEAMGSGNIDKAMHLLRDPTDMPQAAKNYYGSFMSKISRVQDVENIPDSLSHQWEKAREIEANLGAGKMQILMGSGPYAEFQVFNGIAQNEDIETAITSLQMYKEAIASGKPQTPEGYPTIKREVIDHVVGKLEDTKLGFGGYDVDLATVQSTLAPYFKVWGAMGIDQSQMEDHAERLIVKTQWRGMVNGTAAKDAFTAKSNDSDGNSLYEESPDELFKIAISRATDNFKANQSHITGDITVTPLPTDPNMLVFKSSDGIPIVGGIQHVSNLTDLLDGTVLTKKQKVLQGTDKSPYEAVDNSDLLNRTLPAL